MNKTSKAGVSDTRAGLQPAGLYSSAGLFKKGFQDFHPLDASPYLLFDARTSMVGTLENPTLDLDASKTETLDVITATRAGTATYTDASGNIATAPANTVRVDYTQGEELTPTVYQHVLYTDFSTGWSLINATKEAANTPSPSPSYNAIRVTAQNDIYGRLQDYIGVSQDATISVYVKRDGVDTRFQISSQVYGSSVFNINESGVSIESSGGLGYDIQEHGDGWWRVSASFTGVGYVQFRPDNELGTRSVLLAMPQVEEGTTASDFVANTTGSPKFITGATYGPRVPMMLIEPSATNLVTYSNLIASGGWSVSGFSLTQNAIASPDGLNNGTKTEQTSTARNFRGSFMPSSTGTSVTYSFWVKKGSGATHLNRFIIKNESQSPSNMIGSINLESGEIIQNDFGSGNLIVEQHPNGWFKVKATRDTNLSVGDSIFIYPPYSSSSGENEVGQYVYTFGHQLEYGSVATSYIPTSGATVTRAADNLVIDGTDFTDFYNQTEGTVYVEGVPRILVNGRYLTVSDATTHNRVILYEGGGLSRLFVAKDDVTQAYLGNTASSINTLNRIAASYKLNNFLTSANGTQSELPDTSGTPPTSVNRMNVGSNETGSLQLNGHIKRLIYWPTHSDSL